MHANPVRKAKERESDAWRQFKVFFPLQMGAQTKDGVDMRWALTWEEVEGNKTAQARSLAEGYRDPNLKDRNVGIAVCKSRSSSQLQPISLGSLKNGRSGVWI